MARTCCPHCGGAGFLEGQAAIRRLDELFNDERLAETVQSRPVTDQLPIWYPVQSFRPAIKPPEEG